MKILVLGAGLQGTACAFDLLEHSDACVTIADARIDELPPFIRPYLGKRLVTLQLDARDTSAMRSAMKGADAVLCALPYYFNFRITQLAVEVGTHYADLGGNTEIVRQQEALDGSARDKGLCITPDCGLAPGMVNILAAEGIRRFTHPRRIKLFVGGLPLNPTPPLNYQVVYSLEGAIDYYTTLSWVLRGSEPTQVDALTEVEEVRFPDSLGTLEAFHTAGGLSTMPWTYAGSVETMEYKTLRYPGHAAIMRAIRDLGLLDLDPIEVDGVDIRPRDVFIARVERDLRRPDLEDLVALKVIAEGENRGRSGKVTFSLLDRYDTEHQISAMMRTTGYSLSITGQTQATGHMMEKGVRPAYMSMPYRAYVDGLKERRIEIVEEEEWD